MTVGQRVAQKRKELGLSQEGLGEQLGVSRQAIYKWEADATLPEIEKLVALSRIFNVSVGWLLGVEEAGSPAPEGQGGELTETQLKMVEEIVARYLAAQPQPEPPRRRRPYILMVAAALVLVVVLVNLFSRLDRVTADYEQLQSAIGRVNTTVSSQIGSISSQVESILMSQNQLTASYESQVAGYDLAATTVTFAVTATPKTYTPEMTAIFTAESDGALTEMVGELGEGQTFSAQITCPLTDDITLSVIFLTGEQRQTQVLERYDWLLSETIPQADLNDVLWGSGQMVEERPISLSWYNKEGPGAREIVDIQVGLFREQELVTWYQPLPGKPDSYQGDVPEDWLYFQRPGGLELEPGAIYCEAAVVTDQYGNQWVTGWMPARYDEEEDFVEFVEISYSIDVEEWKF